MDISPKLKSYLSTPKVGSYAICAGNYSDPDGQMKTGDYALILRCQSGEFSMFWNEQEKKIAFWNGSKSFFFSPVTDNLKGKTFCITGPLTYTREAIEVFIKLNGGEYKNTINKTVMYLITNATGHTTTKIKKARASGIRIISENDFLEMCFKGH